MPLNLNRTQILQFGKYIIVGVLNTLVTLVVIFLAKSVFHLNPYVSNLTGYAVGIANSFLWNRQWVFQSGGHIAADLVRFLGGCGLCYLAQLLAVWSALNFTPLAHFMMPLNLPIISGTYTLSGYGIATLFGMIVYTLGNYFYNRLFAFKAKK